MSIEFHCEHCNLIVKAPNEVGGRPGKCPHCQGINYIPLPEDQSGEIPLEPLDSEFEKHRRKAASEDFAFQRRIMSDRATPGEGPRGSARKNASGGARSATPQPAPGGNALTDRQVSSLVVAFIEAMAGGSLEKADDIVRRLRAQPAKVNGVIDDLLNAGSAAAYGLPTLPKPVLNGFIRQLRARMD